MYGGEKWKKVVLMVGVNLSLFQGEDEGGEGDDGY